jgi:antagonist of KipI
MTLRVLDPGLYTLVVDFGRPGTRSLGVPVGGAADRCALALGNALVGNPPDAAALEINQAGPTLQAGSELGCVVYGAPFSLASDRQPLTAGTTFTLHPGEELRIGTTPHGLRAYLCVRGGLLATAALGSRSGLGPLCSGMTLQCQAGSLAGRFVAPQWTWNREPRTLRTVAGLQAEWFAGQDFARSEYTLTPASNRMGLRLQGEPLSFPNRELVSEPVCPGTVQVTRDGQCIILGVDCQTIGGYPKVAQVIQADLDKIGQLRPGDRIGFAPISLEEAEVHYRRKRTELHAWLTRLQAAEPLMT